mgnify:CR=1 FL=1
MIANILLTVADKTYKPGESIDKPLSKIDREFLLSGNYISLEDKDDVGSKINYILGKTFELDRLYSEIKTKYDVLYKESKNKKKIELPR